MASEKPNVYHKLMLTKFTKQVKKVKITNYLFIFLPRKSHHMVICINALQCQFNVQSTLLITTAFRICKQPTHLCSPVSVKNCQFIIAITLGKRSHKRTDTCSHIYKPVQHNLSTMSDQQVSSLKDPGDPIIRRIIQFQHTWRCVLCQQTGAGDNARFCVCSNSSICCNWCAFCCASSTGCPHSPHNFWK